MSPAFSRFFKYSTIGFSTFILDLLLLHLLTDILAIHYVFAAGLAFAVAVSINYFLSRRYVFKNSTRGAGAGYVNFLLIGGLGMLLVMGGMYTLVTFWGFNYLFSRVCIAAVTGFWNYLLNLFVNFKVAGKY